MSYVWDNDCRFFRRENGKAIEYSDGQDVESRIEAIICNASDRSVSSTELVRQITDWPSQYHLGKLRHCLLRPLNIKPGDRVLEIGCGCGALTRYLGEIGADTIALEGSPARARIAAARCSDLPNVKVYLSRIAFCHSLRSWRTRPKGAFSALRRDSAASQSGCLDTIPQVSRMRSKRDLLMDFFAKNSS